MKADKIRPVVDGLTDMEEIKTNLSLIDADWYIKKEDNRENVLVQCEDGLFQVQEGGKVCELLELAAV